MAKEVLYLGMGLYLCVGEGLAFQFQFQSIISVLGLDAGFASSFVDKRFLVDRCFFRSEILCINYRLGLVWNSSKVKKILEDLTKFSYACVWNKGMPPP